MYSLEVQAVALEVFRRTLGIAADPEKYPSLWLKVCDRVQEEIEGGKTE